MKIIQAVGFGFFLVFLTNNASNAATRDRLDSRIERIEGFIDRLDKRLERLESRFASKNEDEIDSKKYLKEFGKLLVSMRVYIENIQNPKGQRKDQFATSPSTESIISLKTFIVNLADPGGRRYLKVKLDLELTSKEGEKEIRRRLPEVRDQIILVLSKKTYQQIQGIAGKTALREELTARMNSVLTKGQVKKTYFTEFVVQ